MNGTYLAIVEEHDSAARRDKLCLLSYFKTTRRPDIRKYLTILLDAGPKEVRIIPFFGHERIRYKLPIVAACRS